MADVRLLRNKTGREPTLKQMQWVDAYLECGNATEAAMKAYGNKNRNSAAQSGWENLRRLDFTLLLEKAGVTDAKIAKKIAKGMDAKMVVGDKELDDHKIQHKYVETALKVKKHMDLETKIDVRVDSKGFATMQEAELDEFLDGEIIE